VILLFNSLLITGSAELPEANRTVTKRLFVVVLWVRLCVCGALTVYLCFFFVFLNYKTTQKRGADQSQYLCPDQGIQLL
jgi:hypothetical protein